MSKVGSDHRVYADLKKLIQLQAHVEGFSFLPRQSISSVLSGQHASRLRGRGVNFEEIRGYRIGDDIRSLDWKVTNRTRKPHVRVHTEERERDVLLLVDQRLHMFFGSQVYMKSVIAAETAALAAWRVLSVKDRIGALVFNDQSIKMVKPQRSRKSVMQILHHISTANHQLTAAGSAQNSKQLNTVLHDAERLCGHDCLVILVSDLDGWNEETLKRIKRIKAHNDLILTLVTDPLEENLPEHDQLVISDGELQIAINTKKQQLKNKFTQQFSVGVDAIQQELSKYGIPVLMMDTIGPAQEQLRRAFKRTPGNAANAEPPES